MNKIGLAGVKWLVKSNFNNLEDLSLSKYLIYIVRKLFTLF